MDEDLKRTIGLRIDSLRSENNMKVIDFCEAMGITPVSYHKWISGLSFPTISKIIKIAEMFNVPADYILGIVDKEACQEKEQEEKEREDIER